MGVAKVILNGNTLIDTTQKTVAANKMLSGATALDKAGEGITGSIATKTSSDLTASGATVTAPAGYYASSASKSVSSGSATTPATTITANPTISVSSSTGVISSSVSKTQSVTPTVSAGYVSSGTAGTITVSGSNTSSLSTQAAATITPGTTSQTAVAAGKFTTGAVTVAGDANLIAANIADGVTIFGVLGTFAGGGGGLEYEEGTWTTTYDIATATLSFTNTHTNPPFFYVFYDASGADGLTASSNCICVWTDFNQLSGTTLPESSTNVVYAVASFYYMTSATDMSMSYTCINYPYSNTSVSAKYYYRYWCTASQLKARSTSSSRYWRTGRTYKWIAAWKPTT